MARPRTPPARGVRRTRDPLDQLLTLLLQKPDLVARVPLQLIPDGPDSAALRVVHGIFTEDSSLSQGQLEELLKGTDHEAKVIEMGKEPLLNESDSPDIDLAADVEGIVERLRSTRNLHRQQELLERVRSGEATPAEVAEYSSLYEAMATAKSGNPPTEPRSNF